MIVKNVINNLAKFYKDINSRENAKREYSSLIYNTALPFRDFYLKFKLLKEELAYDSDYLIDDLERKLSPRLLLVFININDLNREFIIL